MKSLSYDVSMGSQVAVITGGAQGIGKQTARVLNDLGWSLALLDLQEVDVTIFNDALSLVGDITSEAFVQSAVDATMKRFGRVDAEAGGGIAFHQFVADGC